jgi:hypothetical protein
MGISPVLVFQVCRNGVYRIRVSQITILPNQSFLPLHFLVPSLADCHLPNPDFVFPHFALV